MTSPGEDVGADPALAAAYKDAAREEPPARLDRGIRAAARRRAGAGRAPFWAAWRMPAATAAVALLAVSVAAMLRDEPEAIRVAVLAPPRAEPVPVMPAAPAPAARSAPPVMKQAGKPAEPAAITRLASSENALSVAVPAPPPAMAAAPEPVPEGLGEARAGAQADALKEAASSYTPRQAYGGVRRDKSEGLDQPAAGGVAQAPAAPKAPVEGDADSRAGANDAAPPAALLADTAAAGAAGAVASAPAPTASAATPQAWLERILRLRRQGRMAAARQSFAGFIARYPGYPLPDSLKPWAARPASAAPPSLPPATPEP